MKTKYFYVGLIDNCQVYFPSKNLCNFWRWTISVTTLDNIVRFDSSKIWIEYCSNHKNYWCFHLFRSFHTSTNLSILPEVMESDVEEVLELDFPAVSVGYAARAFKNESGTRWLLQVSKNTMNVGQPPTFWFLTGLECINHVKYKKICSINICNIALKFNTPVEFQHYISITF